VVAVTATAPHSEPPLSSQFLQKLPLDANTIALYNLYQDGLSLSGFYNQTQDNNHNPP
jgi:hypothetical protein